MLRSASRQLPAVLLALAILLTGQLAVAQITTTAIRGLVRDPSGAVVPNVSLTLKDSATGIERTSQSNAEGSFIFANLPFGTFKLTASASGFQTAVYDSIVVNAGRTTDVTVEMKIGTTATTVEVSATAVQLETSTNAIASTVNNNAIQNLPYTGRDSLSFALFVPGAASGSGGSTFNGLPNASMNISVDGMNNNSQRFKSGGTSFFQFAPARIDAMEEVTVTTTGLDAEAAGQGAMTIRFNTKRGSNQYHFKVLEQFHNEALNATPYMTKLRGLPKSKTRNNFAAGSFSGPLAPFIPYLKDKLFFFAYLEINPVPSKSTYSVPILTPDTMQGNFAYIDKSGVQRTVNLLQLAGQNGLPSAVDPTVSGILKQIAATRSTPGVTLEPIAGLPYAQTMSWSYGTYAVHRFPTARVDYQATPNIAWHGTWNLRSSHYASNPPYPGLDESYATNGNHTNTYIANSTVDWTVTPRMMNSTMFGVQSNAEFFNPGSGIEQWKQYGNRNLSYLPGGTAFNGNSGYMNPLVQDLTPWVRNDPVYQLNDTLSWSKGKHTLKFGGAFLNTHFWEQSWGDAGVLSPYFGVNSLDPAYNVIYNGLPNVVTSNTTDRNNALNLYAMLTGRITGIYSGRNVDEKTHQFKDFSPMMQRFSFNTLGLYAQDSYRVTPHLNVNYGLRWEFDGTIHNTNGVDSMPTSGSFFGPSTGNFQPGVLNGNMNPSLDIMSSPYKSDLVNAAPQLGFAWNPSVENGILGKVLGRDKTVIRASFGMSYYNEGMNAISNVMSGNTGAYQSLSAVAGTDFPYGSLALSSPMPAMSANPGSWSFPASLAGFPFHGGTSIYTADPALKSPYVSNWTLQIQRELAKGTVLTVAYVGNKATHLWHYQSLQETNILENGFATEFKNAQGNLSINRANGKGNSFQNLGLPGQVALPIFETAFGPNGSMSALTSGQSWTSSSFITNLDYGTAGSMAGTLASTSGGPTYFCRLVGSNFPPCAALGYSVATKYPMNFFRANPYVNNTYYQDDNIDTNYHGLQVELKKSLSHGLTMDVNYTWSHALGDSSNSNDQTASTTWFTLRNNKLNYRPSPFDHRHTFTTYWTYELPFGRNRWIKTANPIFDRVLSNWTLGGIQRIITGGPSYLTGGRATLNQWADGGIAFGNGMNIDQLMNRLSTIVGGYDPKCQCFHTKVADIIQTNGSVDPKYYQPGNTPGVIGPYNWYYGRTSFQIDMSLSKDIRIHEQWKLGFKVEATNFLNHPFQTGFGSTTITGTTFGNYNSFSSPRNVVLRGAVEF